MPIFGKHFEEISPLLTNRQAKVEKERPERLPFEKFAYINRYEA